IEYRRTESFFFSSRRRHTRCSRDWSSDVCSSDLSGSTTSAGPCRWDTCTPTPARRPISSASASPTGACASYPRMCVTYGRWPSGAHRYASSAASAYRPGAYSRPEDSPTAPSARPASTRRRMAASSSGSAAQGAGPRTSYRTVPCGTRYAVLTAVARSYVASRSATVPPGKPGCVPLTAPKYRLTNSTVDGEPGAYDSPSWPRTTVVIPWRSRASWTAGSSTAASAWTWASTNPGAT